jgi:hypothetical protein
MGRRLVNRALGGFVIFRRVGRQLGAVFHELVEFRFVFGVAQPLANSVWARIKVASALPEGSAATVLARASSTWLPPAVTNKMAVPLLSP